MEYKFQPEDKFFIIASDGVWEFIESDEVILNLKPSV
jgi:serine/threonine protein phosphatase PrpC